jgi:hypothetical protein
VTSNRLSALRAAAAVRALPYCWPGAPEAAAAVASGTGTCASKHALLALELERCGVGSSPLLVLGRLIPAQLANEPEFADGAELLEVHECLTVHTQWAGPLLVDVTWDPPLVEHGLTGAPWDGSSDTPLALEPIGAGWSVPRAIVRQQKEALRSRIYGPTERTRRDELLASMSARFAAWRG